MGKFRALSPSPGKTWIWSTLALGSSSLPLALECITSETISILEVSEEVVTSLSIVACSISLSIAHL